MSTATTYQDGDDFDGDLSRGMAAMERHLTDLAPGPTESSTHEGGTGAAGASRVSRRVAKRRAEHVEAAALRDFDGDETPFLVVSERVRAKRKAVREAGQMWRLDQDPMVLAYRDARMRRLIVTAGLVALTLALAWSTAGVQAFAAEGAPAWSPGWVFAWLVEPFCSLALLMVVGGRAYLMTRNQPVHDKSITRTEWVFLGLTLGMNAWQHLPLVAEHFSLSTLVLHLLGPIVAVSVVRCLPPLIAAFTRLSPAPAGDTDRSAPAPPSCSADTTATGSLSAVRTAPGTRTGDTSDDATVAEAVARIRDLIAAGDLPPNVGVRPIRRTLQCAMATATRVRDELNRA